MRKNTMKKAQVNFELRCAITKAFIEKYGKGMYEKATAYGGQANSLAGMAPEQVLKIFGSSKLIAGRAGENDGVGYIPDSPKANRHYGRNSIIEHKCQGADISKEYHAWLEGRLKVDYFVYWLRKPYQNPRLTKEGVENSPCVPVIVEAEAFMQGVTAYALRKDKSNGDKGWFERTGQATKDFTIEPNTGKWLRWIEAQTVYSPLHRYTYDEIVNHTETLNQTDYDAIYTFFDVLGV